MSDTPHHLSMSPMNISMNNMPMSNNMSYRSLKICSLNCRSLSKISNPQSSSLFIRYLRQLKCDIFCFQETNASSADIQMTLNLQLQAHSSYWTKYCGIVSLTPSVTIHPAHVNIDNRGIVCRITHINDSFEPFMLANIYAPAQQQPRYSFYASMLNLPMFQNIDTFSSPTNPILIVGDFNYHAIMYESCNFTTDIGTFTNNHSLLNPQHQWHNLVSSSFHNVMQLGTEDNDLPTFRRESSATTIDYFYASSSFLPYLRNTSVDFVFSEWTDHALVSVQFQFLCDNQGPGLWRANPLLSSNSYFDDALSKALDNFHNSAYDQLFNSTVQDQWDRLKSVVQDVARHVGRRKADWRRRALARLQRKRNKILREYKSPSPSARYH